MKTISRLTIVAFLVFSGLTVFAQDRGRPSGGSSGSAAAAPSTGGTSGAVATRGISGGVVSSNSVGGMYSEPTRGTGAMYGGGGGGGSASYVVPRYPVGSSFNSYNYDRSLSFFNYLQNNYWFEMMQLRMFDFNRFYRNREPLVTPAIVQITMREPLSASQKLLASVDELQAMMDSAQAGKPVEKADIEAKTQEIRSLAKKIRQYEPIAYFDLRKSRDLTKGYDNLGPAAVSQLRELALQLNSQLKSMYDQKVTSTVSVNSLNQASFESLSKGIEKLTKVIENSKPRM
jgi:hypothetical protein